MTFTEFRQIAKEEFFYTLNAYFMPVTFVWVLCTKGWTAAKMHAVEIWTAESPILARTPNVTTRSALDAAERGEVTKIESVDALLADLND